MSTVTLLNVAKAYGSVNAVEDMTLCINQGELVALLGPSGCGKTTTLRMVAGFIEPTSGKIFFDNKDVTGLPPNRRNTGMVFQGFALFPHLTVFENIAYGLRMRKVPSGEIKDRVAKIIDQVQLGQMAQRLPKQLSGGQQQRVALARALVINPDVLLLDEPLSALDAKLRHEVRLQIRGLQQTLGLTTIFVTHDQEEAMSLADRLVVMSNGRVEQIGTPSELYEQPKTPFVADFIGKSNFIEGHLKGQTFITHFGVEIRLALNGSNNNATLLAIRPEKIRLEPMSDNIGPEPNKLIGKIEFVSYLGPTTEYSIRTQSGPLLLVHQQNESTATRTDLTVGSQVALKIAPESCMLFDGRSQKIRGTFSFATE